MVRLSLAAMTGSPWPVGGVVHSRQGIGRSCRGRQADGVRSAGRVGGVDVGDQVRRRWPRCSSSAAPDLRDARGTGVPFCGATPSCDVGRAGRGCSKTSGEAKRKWTWSTSFLGAVCNTLNQHWISRNFLAQAGRDRAEERVGGRDRLLSRLFQHEPAERTRSNVRGRVIRGQVGRFVGAREVDTAGVAGVGGAAVFWTATANV